MAIEPISTTNLDADSDSPRLARQQIYQTVRLINEVIADARLTFSQNPVVLPVNTGGTPDYSGAAAQCRVFRFVQEETTLWTFSAVATYCTVSITSGGVVSVSDSSKDVAYIDVVATRSGYSNVTGRISVLRNVSLSTASAPDTNPPPTPLNFSAVPGINTVHTLWTAPSYTYGRGNERTNIYGAVWDGVSARPVFESASVLMRATVLGYVTVGDIPSEPSTKWCLWIKFQSKDGIESITPAGGLNGFQVETGLDPSKLLAVLHNQITTSELNVALGTQIGLISASGSTVGSVAYQVAAEAVIRATAVALEVSNRTTAVALEVSNRVSAINALNAVKNRFFYTGSQPTSDGTYTLNANDTWFDTSNNNKEYRYNGSAWVLGGDLRLAQAVTDISSETTQRVSGDTAEANVRTALYAGVTAGTGNDYKIFNQSIQPTGTTIGDVWTWIDVVGTATFRRWSGSSWVDSSTNTRAAYYRGAYADQTAISGLTGNIIGDLARRITDNTLLVWQGSSWVTVSTPTSFQYAFLDQEATTRVSTLASEASMRTTLATQMRGAYTGTDITQVTTGSLFFNEVAARSLADSTEVTARQLISTKAFGVVDPASSTLANLSTGILFDEKSARSTADSAEVTARQFLSTRLVGQNDPTGLTVGTMSSGLLFDESFLRSSADTSQVGRISTIETSLASGGVTYNSIVAVNTTATSKNASFVQSTTPTATKVNDTWIDTSNGRVLKSWNGSTWVLSDDTRIGASASQITTLQSSVNNGASASFEGLITWDFNNTLDGWSVNGGTTTLGTSVLTVTSTGNDPAMISPSGLTITGALYDKVRARVWRVAGSGWDGSCFYATSGHNASGSYFKTTPDTTVIGQWVVLEWDMTLLSAGGADWLTSTITQVRIDLGATSSDVFIVDWISVGKRGAGAAYATVQQEISTRAAETGYLGSKYYVRAQVTSGGRTVMGGFGIEGTSAPGQQATLDFGVQANKFWIGAPSTSSGISDVQPFIVKTTVTVDAGSGLTIPVGVYMDSAYITNLTALWGNFGSLVANTIVSTNISASMLTVGTGVIGGQLRSSNYVASASGWVLKPDGTAQLPAAYILGKLTAAQVDTNGVSVTNATGVVVFSAGTSLDFNSRFGNTTGMPANSATVGAQAGVNLKDSGGAVLTDSAVKNSSVSLGPDGALNGAGGGQLTRQTFVDGGSGTTFGQRGVNDSPASYGVGTSLQFKETAAIGLSGSTYCGLETIKIYGDNSGGYATQYAYVGDGKTYKRIALVAATSWNAWVLDLDRASYTGSLDATTNQTDLVTNNAIGVAGTTANWVNIAGQTNAPANNATVGAPAGTYVGGNLAQNVETWSLQGNSAYSSVTNGTTGLAKRLLAAGDILGGVFTIDTASAPSGIRTGSLAWNQDGSYSSGYGVAMTAKGIIGYNSSGVQTFAVDATNGNALFGGTLTAANMVSTGNIVGNAITVPGYAALAADNFMEQGGVETIVLSLTMNTGGNPVFAAFGFEVSSSCNPGMPGMVSTMVRIRINSVLKHYFEWQYDDSVSFWVTRSGTIYEASPPSGPFTITISTEVSGPLFSYGILRAKTSTNPGTDLYALGTKR